MRNYGKIDSGFDQNPRIRRLSEDGRYLLLYLFRCRHGNAVGCFILPMGYATYDLQWEGERVTRALDELAAFKDPDGAPHPFVEHDRVTGLVRLTGWWGHNTLENRNVATGAMKALRSLPRCPVFYSAVKELNSLANKFLDPYHDELLNMLANSLANGSRPRTLPEPEPEPDPEPEPELETRADRVSKPGSPPPRHSKAWLTVQNRVCELAGIDLANVMPDRWQKFFAPIDAWLASGADPELDIYPTVKRLAETSLNGKPPRSLGYFTSAIDEARLKRETEDIPGFLRRPTVNPVTGQEYSPEEQTFLENHRKWIDAGRKGPEPKIENYQAKRKQA